MGILGRLFRKTSTAKSDDPRFDRIVQKLVSQNDTSFGEGQTEVLAIPTSDPLRLRAIREAIRIRSGKEDVSFYEPNVDGLIVRDGDALMDGDQMLDERALILRLAARKSLLEDPQASGSLLITFLAYNGFESVVQLANEVRDVGGVDQSQAYQLLYNQNRSSLLLRRPQNDLPDYRIVTTHEFDEHRARAQRDPARLEETGGQLLSVKCLFCGQIFVVGQDAIVVTDEDIDWRGSRQPDVIMPIVPTDKEAAAASGASVLSAVRKGEKRTWRCEQCHNQTPQSYFGPFGWDELSYRAD
ncbi:MAG TPA: hypothetical protein VK249_23710 [Anaerolineales bacterium]|nr:hypothetical protein [Anaerolineales bacterium]